MITPPYITNGDAIGLIAPAKKVDTLDIEKATSIFESWGFKVKTGRHLFKECHQFAGTDLERAEDLQYMMDDKEVKAIICARGGYGSLRLLEKVNFDALNKMPKWLVGYSDITTLHTVINHQFNMESIHGTMPINFPAPGEESQSIQSLYNALTGGKISYTVNTHSLNVQGQAEGQLTGGNLSVLYSLAGTKYDIDTTDKILFLEDIDEYLYHIDRMMMNLKLAGKLDKVRGIIVGGMTDMHDNQIPFGKTAEEIIHDIVKEYNIPTAFGFQAGHVPQNLALIMGRHVTLEITDSQTCLTFN